MLSCSSGLGMWGFSSISVLLGGFHFFVLLEICYRF
jgi:hypothetical protein